MTTLSDTTRLLISFIVPFVGSWNVNLQIFLEADQKCNKFGSCQQDIALQDTADYLNVSFHTIPPEDLFARLQAEREFGGDVVLTSVCKSCMATFLDTPELTGTGARCCSTCTNQISNVYIDQVHLSANEGSRQTDSFLNVLSYILKNEKLLTYIVIMTSIEDTDNVLPLFSNERTQTLSYIVDEYGNFPEAGQLKEIFENIDETHLNFVVICSPYCLETILNEVKAIEAEVTRHKPFKRSRWLLVPKGSQGHVEGQLLSGFTRIESADISIVSYPSCQQQRTVLNIQEMGDQITTMTGIDSKQTAVDTTKDIVQDLLASVRPAVAEVYTVLATRKGQELRLNGKVASDNSIQLTNELFDSDKYGYNNRTFVVGMLAWPPFVYKEEVKGTVRYTGLSVDLLEEMASKLNFSYTYKESDDQEWGRVLDGKWTGLVGEIGEGKLDMIITPLTISKARESVMDFTPPYFYVHSMVIFGKQDPNANKWLTLIAPFRYEVHICILFSLILSTVFLFMVEEVNPVNIWTDNRLSERRTRYGDILWYHFGALMANGGAYLPNTVSGRSVLACWWIFTVMMAAIYSGNLIAFLAVSTETPPFSTLSEMISTDGQYKWGVLGGSAIITLFESSERSDYRQIWDVIERESPGDPDIQSLDLDVHLKKVLTEKYAYIGDSTTWEVWQTKSCDLSVLDERFYPMTYGVGLPNNSIHTKVFSNQLLRIQESGLVEVWHQRWKPAVRCEKGSNGAQKADILALQSAFYAAGAGVLLAILILTTEHVYNRTCKGMLYPKWPCLQRSESTAI